MIVKNLLKILLILSLIFPVTYFFYLKFYKKNAEVISDNVTGNEDVNYNSNIILNVEYTSKDSDGNEYLIRAEEGTIDYSNPSIIFLKEVNALIKLNNSEDIRILSDFGKYNSENFDTIFSKNVIINYLVNKITGDYLDFSLERNSILISKNVIFKNPSSILKADVFEMDIITKDAKIFMYEEEKKVEIISTN
ncbi:LPS export ABC transporter periplasmic protein LptC [Candidatus Pelagibacter sp. HIMB1521]|uniref:LPS export ABC transporter periplasmic protein LptC n=1 Tax=Candidatus Pelagibacter sp. HIMB1521 TaxID=3413344 RepID=UPI003F879983